MLRLHGVEVFSGRCECRLRLLGIVLGARVAIITATL